MEEVYFDELFVFEDKIRRRKLADYKMQLAISENPHVTDRQSLWDTLNDSDPDYVPPTPHDEKFDQASFDRLKSVISQFSNSNIAIKDGEKC